MNIAANKLLSIVERIENLTAHKQAIAADIRDIYAEAKQNGFDTKALRHIIKMRSMEVSERQEQEFLLETYARALGLITDENA
jgi:uncharacterized protein (UPF0335 family)